MVISAVERKMESIYPKITAILLSSDHLVEKLTVQTTKESDIKNVLTAHTGGMDAEMQRYIFISTKLIVAYDAVDRCSSR